MSVTPAWLCVVAYRLGQVRQQLGFVSPLSLKDKQEVQRWLPSSALPLFYTMSNADQQHSLRVCRGLQAQGCIERDMLAAALLHDVGKAQGRVPFWTRPVIVLGKRLAPRLLMRMILPLAHASIKTNGQTHQSTTETNGQTRPPVGASIHHAHGVFLASRLSLRSAALTGGRTLFVGLRNTETEANRECGVVSMSKDLGWWGKRPHNASHSNANPSPSPHGRDELTPLPWLHASRQALSYAWWHAEIGADLASNAGLSERAVLYIRTHHEPHGPAAELHRVDEVS